MTSRFVENPDVLVEPPTSWETGLPGAGSLDLVADTGILTTYLDNSKSNSEGLAGLYSPENDNALIGFEDGMPVRVIMGLLGQPNLVLNPGLEDVNAVDWAEWIEDDRGGAIADDLVHGGEHAVKLSTIGAGWYEFRQSVALDPSRGYAFTFWTRGDGVQEGIYSLLFTGSTTDIDTVWTGVSGTVYTQVTVEFTTASDETAVLIRFESPWVAGVTYFDDVALVLSELVVNPGFETAGGGGADVFANWEENAGHGGDISDEGVIVHSGSHACKISKPAGDWRNVKSDNIVVVPGTLLRPLCK